MPFDKLVEEWFLPLTCTYDEGDVASSLWCRPNHHSMENKKIALTSAPNLNSDANISGIAREFMYFANT